MVYTDLFKIFWNPLVIVKSVMIVFVFQLTIPCIFAVDINNLAKISLYWCVYSLASCLQDNHPKYSLDMISILNSLVMVLCNSFANWWSSEFLWLASKVAPVPAWVVSSLNLLWKNLIWWNWCKPTVISVILWITSSCKWFVTQYFVTSPSSRYTWMPVSYIISYIMMKTCLV